MGYLKRVIKETETPEYEGAVSSEGLAAEGYPRPIDLGSYVSRARGVSAGRMSIKVAEIERYEDLRDLSTYVYDGDILILDFTPIANDELTLRRIIAELRRLTEDVNGDLAGLEKNLIIVAPRSVRIDKRKIRRSSSSVGGGGGEGATAGRFSTAPRF